MDEDKPIIEWTVKESEYLVNIKDYFVRFMFISVVVIILATLIPSLILYKTTTIKFSIWAIILFIFFFMSVSYVNVIYKTRHSIIVNKITNNAIIQEKKYDNKFARIIFFYKSLFGNPTKTVLFDNIIEIKPINNHKTIILKCQGIGFRNLIPFLICNEHFEKVKSILSDKLNPKQNNLKHVKKTIKNNKSMTRGKKHKL